jgi:HEAT repeat protein
VKLSLPLKLGMLVLVLFGLVIAGIFLYRPVRFYRMRLKLESGSPADRSAAIQTLAAERKKAFPYLRDWICSGNDTLTAGSIDTLAEMKDSEWTSFMTDIKQVLDGSLSEATDSAAALLIMKEYDWKTAFRNHPTRMRNVSCRILKDSDDAGARSIAAWKLGLLRDRQAVDRLIGAIKSTEDRKIPLYPGNKHDEYERAGHPVADAAWALGEIGDRKAVGPLIELLESDANEELRREAAWALGKLKDARAVKPLIAAAEEDKSYVLSATALDALSGIDDKVAVEDFIDVLLNSKSEHIRTAAAESLGMIGSGSAVTALSNALQNAGYCRLRWKVAEALGFIGDNEAVIPLISALRNDAHKAVKYFAMRALGRIGDGRAVKPLIKALRRKNALGNYYVLPGAGRWGRRLAGHLDCFFDYRTAALNALGRIGDPIAVAPIASMMNEDDPSVRGAAVKALAVIDSLKAVEFITVGFEYASKSDVGAWCGIALLRKDRERYAPEIRKALVSGNFSAAPALAWFEGGEYLKFCLKKDYRSYGLKHFLKLADARWGNSEEIESALWWLRDGNDFLTPFREELLEVMPDDFPEIDLRAHWRIRRKQIKEIDRFFEKNKGRFAWDKMKMRYYLSDSKSRKAIR